jgi:hypothetical protein
MAGYNPFESRRLEVYIRHDACLTEGESLFVKQPAQEVMRRLEAKQFG